jgi:AhpC/TSA family
LAEYASRHGELTSLGFGLAALSVDPPDRSRALSDQLSLPFPLLCDPGREVVRSFGVLNEHEKGGIAYPATFVLDRDRAVRFRSLDRTAARVDLRVLFTFLRGGVGSEAPIRPARTAIFPTLGDWARIVRNGVRHGIRSPKT